MCRPRRLLTNQLRKSPKADGGDSHRLKSKCKGVRLSKSHARIVIEWRARMAAWAKARKYTSASISTAMRFACATSWQLLPGWKMLDMARVLCGKLVDRMW